MTTQFHLLVRSPRGQLSECMRRAQNEYSRRFNLRREREGALVRGRSLSIPIESEIYRRIVVRYIDANPVRAGQSERSVLYPHGSAAQHYRGSGPIWLERSWIESEVICAMGSQQYRPKGNATVFESYISDGARRLVKARFGRIAPGDPLNDLFGANPAIARAWLAQKAECADRIGILGSRAPALCLRAEMPSGPEEKMVRH